MGKIIKKRIEYTGGGGSSSGGKEYTGVNGIQVDNTLNTISASMDIARTSQIPTKVSDLANDANYQNGTQVDNKINSAVSSVYTYKGTVATTSALPNNASTGDVYNVEADGLNYAFNGTSWEPLAGTFDISGLIENPTSKTARQILEYDGTQWVASSRFVSLDYGARATTGYDNSAHTTNGTYLYNRWMYDEPVDGYSGATIDWHKDGMVLYEMGANGWEPKVEWRPEQDTGWQTLPVANQDITAPVTIRYRKKNGVVYLNIHSQTLPLVLSPQTYLATLPAGFFPTMPQYNVGTTTGYLGVSGVTVRSDGAIYVCAVGAVGTTGTGIAYDGSYPAP